MLTLQQMWTLMQECRHKYTTGIHFVCIYTIVPEASLRSAFRVRLGWIGQVSQLSRGSQICGVAGTQIFQTLRLLLYRTSRALMKYQDFISQLPSSFRKALHKRQLPVTTEIFRRLILCHFNLISACWKTGSLKNRNWVLCHCVYRLDPSILIGCWHK